MDERLEEEDVEGLLQCSRPDSSKIREWLSRLPSYQARVLSGLSCSPFRAESQDAKRTAPSNGYTSKVKVQDRYQIVGYISSGTYGRVYKAVGHNGQSGEFAIKKFGHCYIVGRI